MGTVVQLRNQINNSYYQLKDSVDEKLVLVEEKIKSKLLSEVDLSMFTVHVALLLLLLFVLVFHCKRRVPHNKRGILQNGVLE